MSLWQRFKLWQSGWQKKNKKKKYSHVLGNHFHLELTKTAAQKKIKQRKPASDSQTEDLPYDISSDARYPLWMKLSPREQDVTALTCLRYTNSQIAARLGLSKETVRTYLDKVMNKLDLQTKADLRVIFANWDFGEWERRNSHR